VKFVTNEMSARGWSQADLSRASGLSRQHVSKMLSDDRDRITRMPEQATLDGLAKALAVPRSVIALHSLRAYGIDVDVPYQRTVHDLSDDELVTELKHRLTRGTKAH
jgi:transcriptional regulator with XRE-family HTH domain